MNCKFSPQKKGQSPHEMVSSSVYNSLWSALAVIGGYDSGLRIGSRFESIPFVMNSDRTVFFSTLNSRMKYKLYFLYCLLSVNYCTVEVVVILTYGGGGANGEMANLTNEKGKFAIAIFRHFSPFFAIFRHW